MIPALSPRRAAWLLICDPQDLTADGEALRLALQALCPPVETAQALAQRFVHMVRDQDSQALDLWLSDADACLIPELQRFAAGLRRDYAAVSAALKLPWSNGQVEGQVNPLKLIKRSMFSRANFDLLRLRVLYAI